MRGEREQLGPDEGKLYRPHTPKTSVNVEIPGVCGASASAETLPQMARRGLLPTPPKEIQQVRGVTGGYPCSESIHSQRAGIPCQVPGRSVLQYDLGILPGSGWLGLTLEM